jgi:hypothetical protein
MLSRIRFSPQSVACFSVLDPEFHYAHERLIVAPRVASSGPNVTVLSDASVMPKIPGFSALVTALFAPDVEFETNAEATAFLGVVGRVGRELLPNSRRKTSIHPARDVRVGVSDTYRQVEENLALKHALSVSGFLQSVTRWLPIPTKVLNVIMMMLFSQQLNERTLPSFEVSLD